MASRRHRAQSAMEYLMTYGWAILVIAVVLGALFQLGVFGGNNAPRAPPGSCSVFKTSSQIALQGLCTGILPQYVATFASNQYVNVPTGASGTKISVFAWIYQTTADNPSDSVYQYSTGLGWILRSGGATVLEPYIGSNYYCSCTVASIANGWHQYGFTADSSGNVVVYLDGVARSTTAWISGTLNTATALQIGSGTGTSSPYNGRIANVQIYNTTLSASEVQALYLQGIGAAPVRPQNIEGWWPLNGNANDYSGNLNNGAQNGGGYTSLWTSGYTVP